MIVALETADVRLEQANRRDWVGKAGAEWLDAPSILAHLKENTNLFDAANDVPWVELLVPRATVLDLGCGSGWLTGLISARSEVEQVIAWDGSLRLLRNVLPEMVHLVGGELAKVRCICGEFTPLVLEDASVDLVVMSSAFHHCREPHKLLSECHRILCSQGTLVLLNESPYPIIAMLRYITTTAVAATVNCITPQLMLRKSGHVAADHILYDDVLGDRALTLPQWKRLFSAHPFKFEICTSVLPAYKKTYRKRHRFEKNLTHFVLRRL